MRWRETCGQDLDRDTHELTIIRIFEESVRKIAKMRSIASVPHSRYPDTPHH
jgi:hypothetical protein